MRNSPNHRKRSVYPQHNWAQKLQLPRTWKPSQQHQPQAASLFLLQRQGWHSLRDCIQLAERSQCRMLREHCKNDIIFDKHLAILYANEIIFYCSYTHIVIWEHTHSVALIPLSLHIYTIKLLVSVHSSFKVLGAKDACNGTVTVQFLKMSQ